MSVANPKFICDACNEEEYVRYRQRLTVDAIWRVPMEHDLCRRCAVKFNDFYVHFLGLDMKANVAEYMADETHERVKACAQVERAAETGQPLDLPSRVVRREVVENG